MYVMTAIFEANVFPVSRISEHWWRRTPAAASRKWRSSALAQTGVRQGSWFWRVREETEAEESTAARHLANHGAQVELCLATPDKLGEIQAWQRKLFQSTNGREVSPRDLDKGAAWVLAASNRTPEGIQIVAAWAEMAVSGSPG